MTRSKGSISSLAHILKEIADDNTLVLLNSIALSSASSGERNAITFRKINPITKQYYSRISSLISIGLVERHERNYSLTLMGKIIFNAHLTIHKALNYYWKIKALDSLQMSATSDPKLKGEKFSKLIDAMIDNHQLKDILTTGLPGAQVPEH